jgi:subtilisin family serine protease
MRLEGRRFPTAPPVVVVLDGGVDYLHPDLDGSMWTNPGEVAGDGVDNDENGVTDDIHGFNVSLGLGDPLLGGSQSHGTHVAGLIAAEDDGVGMTGVAAGKAQLLSIGGFFDGGDWSVGRFERAVDYVVDMKKRGENIRVLNASFGDELTEPQDYARLHQAIQKLAAADILLVAAAGNDELNIDEVPRLPATDTSPNVLTVAALDFRQGAIGLFSAYGPRTVELAAPGSSIYSTEPGGGYRWGTGTSMAAPAVAGAAALLFAVNPELTAVEARALLLASVDVLPELAPYVSTSGKLNVAAAVALANERAGS